MIRNNSFIKKNINYNYNDAIKNNIIDPISDYKICFFIVDEKLFYKQTQEYYYELLGAKIAKYLNITHTSYDLATINFKDKITSGVIAQDYRKDGYKIISFNDIINDYKKVLKKENYPKNDMNLDFIVEALFYHLRNYDNKKNIFNILINELSNYLLLDLLIGNYDNGKFNYELMENNIDVKLSPYSDFGLTFDYTKTTRFTINDSDDYSFYSNINTVLNNDFLKNKFIKMYEFLTLEKLEELFIEIEKDIDSKLPNNFKNTIYLSYGRHRNKINVLLEDISKKSR